jgi:hypothetical protein
LSAELDALVAEKVMGLNVGRDPRDKRYVVFRDGNDLPVKEWDSLPPYSTDISASWAVVEKMRTHSLPEDPAAVFVVEVDKDGFWAGWRWHEMVYTGYKAKTAPHAICLAALKAAGETVKI